VSSINSLARELNLKVVYYGPGLSGKTTSLKNLYSVLKPDSRGELISLATEGDRTLFFDFLPIHLERVNDLTIRLQTYTVPGQIFYDATRKMVLNGADGVVFVADSQRAALDANLESLDNLADNLAELGIDLDRFPMVLQYNKRDLPNALPVATLSQALNKRSSAEFESVADKGQGVYPTFKELVRQALADVRSKQRRASPKIGQEPPGAGANGAEVPEATLTNVKIPLERPKARASAAPGLSFAPLVPSLSGAIHHVEQLIVEKQFGPAVHAAATRLAALLGDLPSTDPTPAAKAALLGLDGREYLRLCRLAGLPDQGLSEADALFAVYLLLGAGLKAERI
jgi:signal recognition particle receptor subunit beta